MNNIREKKCKNTKIAYQNEKKAKQAMHQQQDWGARVCRVYQCPECGLWHLTSTSSADLQNAKHTHNRKYRYKRKNEVNGYRGSYGYGKRWLFDT